MYFTGKGSGNRGTKGGSEGWGIPARHSIPLSLEYLQQERFEPPVVVRAFLVVLGFGIEAGERRRQRRVDSKQMLDLLRELGRVRGFDGDGQRRVRKCSSA